MLKILLVDDSEDSRLLVPALLRKYACQIDTAENGQVALDRLSAASYDLVLMDMQMPVLDGFEATRMIRERERGSGKGKRLPIIAMSAFECDAERAQMASAGCDDHLSKPFRKEQLLALLNKLCDNLEEKI